VTTCLPWLPRLRHPSRNPCPTKYLFGSQRIVTPTKEHAILYGSSPLLGVRYSMLDLEEVTLAAAVTFGIDEGAATLIALPNFTPHCSRDVARVFGWTHIDCAPRIL